MTRSSPLAVVVSAFLVLLLAVVGCGAPAASPAVTTEPPATEAPAGSPTIPDATAQTDAPASPAPTDEPASPGPTVAATSAEPLRVLASTTVLADFARQVGGDRVVVRSMIPAGRDVHTYDPAPSDAQLLAEADLVLINGLGLDDWLEDLVVDTAADVPLVVVGEDLEGVEYLEGHDHDDDGPDHGDEEDAHALNPHVWLDVGNARRYAARIAETLAAHDSEGGEAYASNATAFDEVLAQLDDAIRQQVAAIPEDQRRVVSLHDAFPYFAHAYDIEIVGVVVDAPGQEPSAGELAELVAAIRQSGVRAVLSEAQLDDRLAQVVAAEAGVSVVDGLYTDSVGDPPLDTYEATMRWNVEQIVAGLR